LSAGNYPAEPGQLPNKKDISIWVSEIVTLRRFPDARESEFNMCTDECLVLIADTWISGMWVARELDRLLLKRGKPMTIVSENGTESAPNTHGYVAWMEASGP
jgi:hypothetical protein